MTWDEDNERERRALARGRWPVRVFPLGEEPADDLSAHTSPVARVLMMWSLACDAWALAGKPMPNYRREHAPTRLLRRLPEPGDDDA